MKNPKSQSARQNVKWISGAINPAHKGMLHTALHVPKGDKIPKAKLQAAAKNGNSPTAKRARLAMTLRSFH